MASEIVGIDPGKTGGLCHMVNGQVMATHPMPIADQEIDIPGLVAVLLDMTRDFKPVHIWIEKSQAGVGWGSGAVFRYGQTYGTILGVCQTLKFPITLVSPRKWQKQIHTGLTEKTDPKKRSLIISKRLFPGVSFLKTERCKKPHDGMIDAALIAWYGFKYG